jgi:RNA polymerase sigma-70 factor (ECF subfamily)
MLAKAHLDYEKKLNVRAFFKLSDHELSEDLVQQTFMKTWVYLVKGGKIDIMRAFLYHILNDLIIDEYRRHKSTSLNVLQEKGFEPSGDNSERLFNYLDGKALLLLIRRLPDTYQKVMYMRYVQELSIKEMAILTNQSKNAVTVQTHRGLKKLKLLYSSQNIK